MGFLKKLFGLEKQRLQDADDGVVFVRGPKAVGAEPGKVEETFISETAAVLGCNPNEVDPTRDLQKDYGCDELDVIEIIQIAEDLWDAQLLENPITTQDCSRALSEYRTLSRIMYEARLKGGI